MQPLLTLKRTTGQLKTKAILDSENQTLLYRNRHRNRWQPYRHYYCYYQRHRLRRYPRSLYVDSGQRPYTPQVRDAIVAAVPGVSSSSDVTEAHLATITTLDLSNKNISALKVGDFDGLSSLKTLFLDDNQLTSLPENLFSGLTALKDLYLYDNQLTNLPENLFSGLSSLRQLNLHTNRLTNLPANVFSGLSSLTQLYLRNNRLTNLSAEVFSGLSSLQYLYLDNNQLRTLPAGGIFRVVVADTTPPE